MRYLTGQELDECTLFLDRAKEVAKNATCLRDKCGSILVKNGKIIGEGFNSPPANHENQRRCLCDKSLYHPKVKDQTCCIHAEQRAIMDALKRNADQITGSRLYFVRLDAEENISPAGKPYCTICSKMTLDSGVSEFVLIHQEGICVYDTDEYNLLSFAYQGGA